jgi:predicted nucleic acid-binding Zn ribbon protein
MAVHTPRMRSIEEELDAFWGKAAGAEVMEMNTIRQNWHYIVGEKLAEHSQVIRRENSKLFVSVDHPAWQMELRRMKNLLCKRVNEYTGNEKITDLVFVSKRVSS